MTEQPKPDIAAKIAAARALEAAAMPAPWESTGCADPETCRIDACTPHQDRRVTGDMPWTNRRQSSHNLIVHARHHYAALWDVVEAASRIEQQVRSYRSSRRGATADKLTVDITVCEDDWRALCAALAKLAEAP